MAYELNMVRRHFQQQLAATVCEPLLELAVVWETQSGYE